MSAVTLAPLPAEFAGTRDALHRLAVYVISPAQRLQNGEIVLRCTAGGFSTFAFDGRVIGVDGADLVVDGVRHPIGSLNDTARLAGIAPDVAQQEEFDVPPHGDLDEPLAVDAAAARALGARYAFATEVLDDLRADAGPADDASIVRIWPEHFDAAIDLGTPLRTGARPTERRLATAGTPSRMCTPRRGPAGSMPSSTTPASRERRAPAGSWRPKADARGAAIAFLRAARARM